MNINHRLLFLLPFLYSVEISAQKPYPQLPFSRLFTTSKERDQLNNDRYDYFGDALPLHMTKSTKNINNQIDSNSKVTPLEKNNKITLSGVVVRADGKRIVWIDGKALYGNSKESNSYRIHSFKNEPQKVLVRTKQSKKTLKPGQVWSLTDNTVSESYTLKKETNTELLTKETFKTLRESSKDIPDLLVNKKSAKQLSQAKETLKTMKKLNQSNLEGRHSP